MKRVRITYEGAFHHTYARGIHKEAIFAGDRNKSVLMEFIAKESPKLKIRLLAYCIMDTHYHLVLQNTSGKMSEFFRQVNGQYGKYYRKEFGGKGYVFEDRFQSALIQEELYLTEAIIYVLLNPVNAGIVKNFIAYPWSSAKEYFPEEKAKKRIVDSDFVDELFGGPYEILRFIQMRKEDKLPVSSTRYGDIIGDEAFMQEAIKKFDRRKKTDGDKNLRIDDSYIEPIEKVIKEFEHMHQIGIDDIDSTCFKGKRLRGELLVHLKDRAGLTYSEIVNFPIYSDIKFNSLGKIYQDAKKRMKTTKK